MKRSHFFPGTLISCEGIDGAGKSLLLSSLHTYLTHQGHTVILTKEPGGTHIGRMLKKVLLEEEKECHPRVEFLLFAADRAEHFETVVIPALTKGHIVLSDRMADSSLAYQGFGRSLPLETLEAVNNFAMKGISPDITFYLQLPYEVAYERRMKRNEKTSTMEREPDQFWKTVMKGYEALAQTKPYFHTLDALQSPAIVLKQAQTILEAHFAHKEHL